MKTEIRFWQEQNGLWYWQVTDLTDPTGPFLLLSDAWTNFEKFVQDGGL